MNPCLGLCLRRLIRTPAPHMLVLACQALVLGTSHPLAPGPLFLVPEQGRCLTNCVNDKIQQGKKTFQKLKCVFLVVNESPQVRCPGISRYLVSSTVAEMGCHLFGFSLLLQKGNFQIPKSLNSSKKEVHFLLIQSLNHQHLGGRKYPKGEAVIGACSWFHSAGGKKPQKNNRGNKRK